MRRGRPRKTRRAQCGGARRLTCGSHGRLEAGPGGGPASCCLEISPFLGRRGPPARHTMGQRRPDALAAETDGTRKVRGGRRAAPFLSPRASGRRELHLPARTPPRKLGDGSNSRSAQSGQYEDDLRWLIEIVAAQIRAPAPFVGLQPRGLALHAPWNQGGALASHAARLDRCVPSLTWPGEGSTSVRNRTRPGSPPRKKQKVIAST